MKLLKTRNIIYFSFKFLFVFSFYQPQKRIEKKKNKNKMKHPEQQQPIPKIPSNIIIIGMQPILYSLQRRTSLKNCYQLHPHRRYTVLCTYIERCAVYVSESCISSCVMWFVFDRQNARPRVLHFCYDGATKVCGMKRRKIVIIF